MTVVVVVVVVVGVPVVEEEWEKSRRGDMLYSRRCPIDASLVGK